jgi:quercetin dioxygenase-like cupin family protein
MNQEQFKHLLIEEGFQDLVIVEREADGYLDTHTHPFEAKALILEGSVVLQVDDETLSFKVGDVFHLSHAKPHTERYGPTGVKYLVGRKAEA